MTTFLSVLGCIFALLIALPLPRFVLGIALCCLSGGGAWLFALIPITIGGLIIDLIFSCK